ncbi:MAG: dihydrofolate reductase, partial [Bacteroidota bacterium]
MPELHILVAAAQNGVIGRNNTLPWHIPEDLKRFK